jgi:hypothetical protein
MSCRAGEVLYFIPFIFTEIMSHLLISIIYRSGLFCATILALSVFTTVHAQTYIAGEDEAYFDAYSDGWQSGDQSGRGFGVWQLLAPEYASEDEEQYAGFFIADAASETEFADFGSYGKAFGIYANGTQFEETVAFRAFDRSLAPGDHFSLRFKFEGFTTKFERDAEEISSVGIALRNDATANSLDAIAEGRLFVLAILEGLSTYQLFDGGNRFNTRVFIDPRGAELGITIREDNHYDLQIMTLSDQVVHHFKNRPLQLPRQKKNADSQVKREVCGLALFNLNGGANNAYFSALQVTRTD